VQRRFSDGDGDAWAVRATARRPDDNTRLGVAVHSVRAVPRAALATVRDAAAGGALHVHVSEQVAENDACIQHYGMTPTALLDDAGVLGADSTAVHATHVTADDVCRLGAATTTVCLCPTTERDLADGIGPARLLADAAVPISVGSDQHAVLDLFEEVRGVEMHERLRSQHRGRFPPAELLAMLTRHPSIGWPDAGELAAGRRADLVAVRLDSVRTAGCAPDQALLAAGAADVDTVLVDGRIVVQDGCHVLGDVGALLAGAIEDAWQPR
jgi:cytosine/adenosine deaminase-related metal-dependent hydrolase